MPPTRKTTVLVLSVLALLSLLTVAAPALAQENDVHVIQPGENLFRIAVQYGVNVDALAEANNISNSWQIYAGQTLVIPREPAAAEPVAAVEAAEEIVTTDAGVIDEALLDQPAIEPDAAAETVVEAEAAVESAEPDVYHTVVRGETLASIAQAYGMTPAELAALNNITNPDLIYANQRLLVSGSPGADISEAAAVTHVVQPGEHLAQIAEQYDVSWLEIAEANNIFDPNRVAAGDTLVIPAPSGALSNEAVATDLGIVDMPAAPAAVVTSGRSLIVDLSDSRIYAYEDGRLVRNVLMSPGLPATPTVQGDFTVQRKYAAQTMAGPGYYLPDVPWVMYFYAGYAIHGAYWHENWGVPMSHGCVNLPPVEAEWFYNFAPEGTPVRVQV